MPIALVALVAALPSPAAADDPPVDARAPAPEKAAPPAPPAGARMNPLELVADDDEIARQVAALRGLTALRRVL